jgi:hypothetical protein
MARLSKAVAGFIRQIFSREETTARDLSMSSRDLARAGGYNALGLPGVDSQGYGDIGEALGLDRRLLQRFVDYEQMDEYPDISAALDIYADDATQVNGSNQHTVWIECQEEQVRKDLEDMFYHRLHIEEDVWEITRGTGKYGNDYEEIVIGENGVVGLNYLPQATVRRVEGNRGELLGFVQSYSSEIQMDEKMFRQLMQAQNRIMYSDENELSQGSNDRVVRVLPGSIPLVQSSAPMIGFEDWQVVHFRLRSKNRDSMYGWAVTDPARWVWKRLLLLEDAVLVYKLTRSPSRYAFYVDVGTLSQKEAERALNEVKDKIKKRKFVNPKTGKLDFRFNPLAFDEDFFLATREGRESTRVDVLNGPAYQQVEDVQYFLFKLYAALKVPRAYLGYDENMPSKATLSQEDVRFARTVLRMQREIRNGLHKVGRVHLAARKIDPASIDFNVIMTVPSAIFELGQLEVRTARANLAASMERHVSLYWLLSDVYGLSDDQIKDIMKQKDEEMKKAQAGFGGGGSSAGAGMAGGFEDRIRRANMGNVITEQELFLGRDKESEKRASDQVRKLMHGQSRLASQVRETQLLVRDILEAVRRRAA